MSTAGLIAVSLALKQSRHEPKKEKKWSCAECMHSGQETTDDVACCNCCENGSFFEEYRDEYTLADLGNNWW
jgi:hypothetical protein